MPVLSRDEFRQVVMERDGGKCVVCGATAADAHHLLERRLFADEGFGNDPDNGVALCEQHHLAAERTQLSVEDLRQAAGIATAILPSHLYEDEVYDKWGNAIRPDGLRTPGELFFDPSVQKALREGQALPFFRPFIRHPRTYHLPWSLGATRDDRMMADTDALQGLEVVATLKLDGEQTSFYRSGLHARSLDWQGHESRDWVKALWAQVCSDIPEGWRVCGENMWAVHSLHYTDLHSYFYVHSIWDQANFCLSWDQTLEWASLLGLQVVPTLYRGPFSQSSLSALWTPAQSQVMEGYVVRPTMGFAYRDYRRLVGKFVRPDHVQQTKHWFFGRRLERNSLA